MANFESNQAENLVPIENTNLQKDVLLDPITVEQAAYYINNGLTVVSNNTDIVSRDASGNVIVQDGSYIVIETNSFNIDNISMLKVLDTQFNYFKFPVSVNREFVDPNFDFDFDNISAEFILPLPTDEKGQIIGTQRISTFRENGWFYNGNETASGFKELQFGGGTQSRPNAYTVTEPIYDSLIEQTKTLQFKIQLQWTADEISTYGTYFFTRLKRVNNKQYRGDDNQTIFVNNGNLEAYPFLRATIILDQDTIQPGDSYIIETVSGGASGKLGQGYVLVETCTWDITPVDPPDPNDAIFRNIYSINENIDNPTSSTAIFANLDDVTFKNTQFTNDPRQIRPNVTAIAGPNIINETFG